MRLNQTGPIRGRRLGVIFRVWFCAIPWCLCGVAGPVDPGTRINFLPVGNRVFEDVTVLSSTPDSMSIRHTVGIDQVFFEDLSEELQRRLGFDVERAEEYQKAREHALRERQSKRLQSGGARPPARPRPLPVDLQPEVDLRPIFRVFDSASKDQGRRPSCAIFAVVSALEYESHRVLGSSERLSEEFLSWATLQRVRVYAPQSGEDGFDAGFAIRSVLDGLVHYGIATHAEMPNTFGKALDQIPQPPSGVLENAAGRRTIIQAGTILGSDNLKRIEALIGALNRERAVVVGLDWPASRALRRAFVLDGQDTAHGYGHAVTLVGYTNASGRMEDTRFIFKNSWGLDWGVQGYGIATHAFLEKNLRDAYVIEIVAPSG